MPPSQFFPNMVRPLGQLTQFTGRVGRAEFWPYMVLLAILYLGGMTAVMLGMAMAGFMTLPALFIFIWLLVLMAYAAVVRRMHDVGWSFWWMTAYVVMVSIFIAAALIFRASAGATSGSMSIWGISAVVNLVQSALAIMIFVVCCFRGQAGPNVFGKAPT